MYSRRDSRECLYLNYKHYLHFYVLILVYSDQIWVHIKHFLIYVFSSTFSSSCLLKIITFWHTGQIRLLDSSWSITRCWWRRWRWGKTWSQNGQLISFISVWVFIWTLKVQWLLKYKKIINNQLQAFKDFQKIIQKKHMI